MQQIKNVLLNVPVPLHHYGGPIQQVMEYVLLDVLKTLHYLEILWLWVLIILEFVLMYVQELTLEIKILVEIVNAFLLALMDIMLKMINWEGV